MSTPEWLTKEYMEETLRVYHMDSSVKVQELHVRAAFEKGENYGGVLTKVNVQYHLANDMKTLITKDLMVKTSYEGDAFATAKMAPYDIFNREMQLYEKVLPKLRVLMHEIGDDDQLFADVLYVDYKRQALIFEDLSERDYIMADRITGLDVPHIKLILRKLAKMHAASAVLNEREDGCLESYDCGFFNRYTDNYSTFFVASLKACAQFILENMPDLTNYGHKLQALAPHYMEIGKRCFAPIPAHVNVLTHGDIWVNNVMIKYDPKTTEPVDVLLIDFQYTFWSSPTLDLHYLFNTSLHEHLRLQKQDVLFQYYHTIFASTLEKLNYRKHPVPTLHQFLVQAEEKRFYALHAACVVQPVMINEDNSDADFNALMGEDERALKFKSNLYKNPKVQKNLRNLLPVFDRRGILEVNQAD